MRKYVTVMVVILAFLTVGIGHSAAADVKTISLPISPLCLARPRLGGWALRERFAWRLKKLEHLPLADRLINGKSLTTTTSTTPRTL